MVPRRRPEALARSALTFVRKKPLGAISGMAIVVLVFVALTAPFLTPEDPDEIAGPRFEPPGRTYIMGTDRLGRDVFSRVLYGSRLSLYVGVTSIALGITAGLFIALVTGYAGGWVDTIVQRLVDTLQAFPGLILALFFLAIFQPSTSTVIIAITITYIAPATRILRGQVLTIKAQTYIEAAQAMGATFPRIILRHIMPNMLAIFVVLFSLTIGGAIVIEASLSFLGLTSTLGAPSWGRMVAYGTETLFLSGPWLTVFPSVALAVTVYSFNMLGDALRDTWDPRLRQS